MSTQQHHRVQFDQTVKIYVVPQRTDLSAEERGALWFGPRDVRRIQADNRRIVQEMRRLRSQGDVNICGVDCDEYCERGLEHLRSSGHMEQHDINRICCLAAVLGEQKRQKALGQSDCYALAEASMQGSRWAREKAREEGMNDATIVKQLRKMQAPLCKLDAGAADSTVRQSSSKMPMLLNEKAAKAA